MNAEDVLNMDDELSDNEDPLSESTKNQDLLKDILAESDSDEEAPPIKIQPIKEEAPAQPLNPIKDFEKKEIELEKIEVKETEIKKVEEEKLVSNTEESKIEVEPEKIDETKLLLKQETLDDILKESYDIDSDEEYISPGRLQKYNSMTSCKKENILKPMMKPIDYEIGRASCRERVYVMV